MFIENTIMSGLCAGEWFSNEKVLGSITDEVISCTY